MLLEAMKVWDMILLSRENGERGEETVDVGATRVWSYAEHYGNGHLYLFRCSAER